MIGGGLLSERDRELLLSLPADEFVRPMDIGGGNGTDHSRILQKLARLGLVEQKRRAGHCRPSYHYRRISLFDQLIGFAREYAGVGCAGIDQGADDLTLCGKCGPCVAGVFLRLNGLSNWKGGAPPARPTVADPRPDLCGTCRHYEAEDPIGGHCTDRPPNPMAAKSCGPSFGCVFHAVDRDLEGRAR